MSQERLLRIYKKFYIDEVKAHLLTYGALAGACANCQEMDVKLDSTHCPQCKTEFKYVAFQNVKDHLPKVNKIVQDRPNIVLIDYDDFKRMEAEQRAKSILE